ncbi:MAG: hypothetical protein ACRDRV_20640 [Pseudonocardiaceae bacterium]
MEDDLYGVLGPFSTRKPEKQADLANHPLTRAYLEAGMRLLEKEFSGPASAEQSELGSFQWMSRGRVIEEVRRGPSNLPCQGGKGSFCDRWPFIANYRGDLVRYALRPYRWRDRIDLAREAAVTIGKDKLATVVHRITYHVLEFMTGDTAMRFLFFVAPFVGRDPVITDALKSVYGKVTGVWYDVYKDFFDARDMRLRHPLKMHDFTVLLTAVAEGLALRGIADQETLEQRRSLLGTAVLAFLIACVDPGDGTTLEEVANNMAGP